MAIENIQYVYDNIRFYMRALRCVINQFFMRLEKEQQIESTNKNSIETCEKMLSKLENHIWPLKYVQFSLPRTPKM